MEVIPRNQNYKIFTDNSFTSHALLCELNRMGIMATGTVKETRSGLCPFIGTKDIMNQNPGAYDDIKFDIENSFVCDFKWYDNKGVCLLSTYVAEEPVTNVGTMVKCCEKESSSPSPSHCLKVTHIMGGVDLHDILVELYHDCRVKRYYLRIMYHLPDMNLVKAWFLYRIHWTQLHKPGERMT